MNAAASDKKSKRPILVPVDFSQPSVEALLKACELAECAHQPLVVLHVVHDPAEMPGYYGKVTKKKKLLRIEDLAQEAFDGFMRDTIEEHPDVDRLGKAKTMLVVGLPANRILEVVDKIHASMVVMGSQGRTGLKHFMLGSKAEQVVRLCPVPVLIVKGEKHKHTAA
jgi:nucleotide-binding universal stress UspA family protein